MEEPATTATDTTIEPTAARSRGLAQVVAEQSRQIKDFLANQRDRMDDVEARIAESLSRIIDELVRQRSKTTVNLQELEARAAGLDEESRHVAAMKADLDAARTEWEESRREAERQQIAFLEQLRQTLEVKPRISDDAEQGDFRQRYEMSLEDIRSLREENQTLKDELEELRSVIKGEQKKSQTVAPLSWEAQKQQLLACLAEDFNEKDPQAAKQRLSMEELVEKTQQAIAQKDEEIAELKQLLEKQSENIGEAAIGAAAFGEIIDKDQIIKEERKNLKRLQEELREKLRTAEIDISVQRAKIARERVELEEKVRFFSQQRSGARDDAVGDSGNQEKPIRGRWLTRLGLSDLDK